jgi:hypothetical protein
MLRSTVAARCALAAVCSLAAAAFSQAAMAVPVKDVPPKSWARPAVESVTSKKLMDAPGGVFNGDKPVTRYELAVTLDRLVRYIENGKKPLHPTRRPKSVKLPANARGSVRAALKRLTDYDFISPDSLLLQGTGREVVTAKELSSLLSQVTVRLSDRAEAPLVLD